MFTGRIATLDHYNPSIINFCFAFFSYFAGFADFFPLNTPEFQKRVKMISMDEFVRREGGPDGRLTIPDAMKEKVQHSAKHCDKMKKSTCHDIEVEIIYALPKKKENPDSILFLFRTN